MSAAEQLEWTALWDEPGLAPVKSGHAFSIAGVYQDALTCGWAVQLCRPVTQLAGEEWVQHTWYEVPTLRDPCILLNAVQTALRADAIIVSVHAADELPAELCAWIEAWLPHRLSRMGALAALIGVAGRAVSQAVCTEEYLRTVACRGQLDFVPRERRMPVEHETGLQ